MVFLDCIAEGGSDLKGDSGYIKNMTYDYSLIKLVILGHRLKDC
jgi:hypothetical protein